MMIQQESTPSNTPPGDTPSSAGRSAVQAELGRLLDQFEAADAEVRAVVPGDMFAAQAARERAAGKFWQAGNELGDLFFLLLKYAYQREPEKMRVWMFTICEGRIGELIAAAVRDETVYLSNKLEQLRNLYGTLRGDLEAVAANVVELKDRPPTDEGAAG